MLASEVISLIKLRVGNRPNLDAFIINELNAAVRRLETGKELPRFMLSESASTQCVIGEERLKVPSDFIREYAGGTIWRFDGDDALNPWAPLRKERYEDIVEEYQEGDVPTHYDLVGLYFRLRPIPVTNTLVRMIYFKKSPALVLPTDTNVWLTHAPDLVAADAGRKIAGYMQNQVAYKLFNDDYTEAAANLLANIVEDEEVNMNRKAGED